jgi:delta 1-pyrroline-5-carboxylate dehydrogenase
VCRLLEHSNIVLLLQVGAIVPWNYPFHNVFNPLVAALYAGNGIVIKVWDCTSTVLLRSSSGIPPQCI